MVLTFLLAEVTSPASAALEYILQASLTQRFLYLCLPFHCRSTGIIGAWSGIRGFICMLGRDQVQVSRLLGHWADVVSTFTQ